MTGLFFIPSSVEDKKKLLDDLIKRNKGSAAIDICYAIEVVNALHNDNKKDISIVEVKNEK